LLLVLKIGLTLAYGLGVQLGKDYRFEYLHIGQLRVVVAVVVISIS